MNLDEIPKEELPEDWETWSEKEKQAYKEWLPKINSGGLYNGPADEITADPVCVVAAVLLIAGVGLMFVLGCIAASVAN